MRLSWQHRLFEGRNPGRVVGAFEVLVVLIGKGPDSNKHTNVGQQSRKISIWFLALTRNKYLLSLPLNSGMRSRQIFV